MTDEPGTTTTCKFPGCSAPDAPPTGKGRPPKYCPAPAPPAVNAWRERQRLDAAARGEKAAEGGPASETPVTMARISASELLRQIKTEGDRLVASFDRLLREAGTLADPGAVSAEIET